MWHSPLPIVLATLSLCLAAGPVFAADVPEADVVVYGDTCAAVTAAIEAKRLGSRVILVTPSRHLGGLSSGGLGWTDLGDPRAIGGLSLEFYRRIWGHYQNESAWVFQPRASFGGGAQGVRASDDERKVMWIFEPHVAEQVFDGWVAEAKLERVTGRLDLAHAVTKSGPRITALRLEGGREIPGRVFIDATYEGDLMAKAGVTYTTGRESNSVYGETINGIQTAHGNKNQLPRGIDPWVKPGDPSSGLLPGVNRDAGGKDGDGDAKLQAYCYRMCMTDAPENRIPIDKPEGYREEDYELLFRAIAAGQAKGFFKLSGLPNRKTDSNNDAGLSCDYIGWNYEYPEADYAGRERIARAHEAWQRGLVWTLQNHPRVPETIRTAWGRWGLPKDEFSDTGHWPHQLYIREARRMVSDVVCSERSLRLDKKTPRPVGLGSYQMDSHHVQRYVTPEGDVQNEGDVQIATRGPYQIDYGTIVPREKECDNLLVPVCLSATHIAYGSLRMEPVFMVLGQSAGTAAHLAVKENVPVQRVDYAALEKVLREAGQFLDLPSKSESAAKK